MYIGQSTQWWCMVILLRLAVDDNSDEQSNGELDEERIETEVITSNSDLLELVNNLFA